MKNGVLKVSSMRLRFTTLKQFCYNYAQHAVKKAQNFKPAIDLKSVFVRIFLDDKII